METIAKNAVRTRSGNIYSSELDVSHNKLVREVLQKEGKEESRYASLGFLTSNGRFVSRYEAMKIALNANQIDPIPTKQALFTRDLKGWRDSG